MSSKEFDKSAQAVLRINEKLQAARNNPFSEHNTAMNKLKNLSVNMPKYIPEPKVILDSHGRVVG